MAVMYWAPLGSTSLSDSALTNPEEDEDDDARDVDGDGTSEAADVDPDDDGVSKAGTGYDSVDDVKEEDDVGPRSKGSCILDRLCNSGSNVQ